MAASASKINGANGRDERRSHRKAVAEAGMVTVELSPSRFGLMLNISKAGMAVYTLNNLQVGQQLQISFTPPRSKTKIEAIGEVSWASDGNAGLHIQKIRRGSLETLTKWLASLPDLPTPSDGIGYRGKRPLFESQIRSIEADIRAANFPLDDALQFITERLLALTKANGAAIAVGVPGDMICRGSAGLAPDVGVSVVSTSGLTWECISTGKLILCEDTESDPRVDRDACRQLNLRSSLIAPLLLDGEVKGVLEIFAPVEKAFGEEQSSLLQRLADLTSQLVFGRKSISVPEPTTTASVDVSAMSLEVTALADESNLEPTFDFPIALLDEVGQYPPEQASPNRLRRGFLLLAMIVVILLVLVLGWHRLALAVPALKGSSATGLLSPSHSVSDCDG